MQSTIINGESLFARALELPAGAGRDEFIAAQCLHNPKLRLEIESLLSAHENAGDFLRKTEVMPGNAPIRSSHLTTPGGEALPRTASFTGTLNAAHYAETFLHEFK